MGELAADFDLGREELSFQRSVNPVRDFVADSAMLTPRIAAGAGVDAKREDHGFVVVSRYDVGFGFHGIGKRIT